jgi:hypothetical protein
VRQARHDDLVEVGEEGVEPLGLLGRRGRERASYVAGGDLREHRQVVEGRPVVGDPVDGGVPLPAELLGGHVPGVVRHGPKVLRAVEPSYSGDVG